MSLDLLNIRKDLREDTLNFNHLVWESRYRTGVVKYSLSHNKSRLDVFHDPNTDTLRVNGSLPYFLCGHNFKTTNQDVIKSLHIASDMLNVDLFEGEVIAFEDGVILEPVIPTKEILANHIRIKGMETWRLKKGKYFVDDILIVKMYDEKYNMYKIPTQIRLEAKRDFGYEVDKNYLKVENHYKNAEVYFKERGIKVSRLFKEDFEVNLKNDLLTNYQRIEKGVGQIASRCIFD